MTKEQRINEFLESMMYVKTLKKKNKDDLTYNNIYSALIKFNVNPTERIINLDEAGYFQKWINDFANRENIDVFVANDWQYFCQFVNVKDSSFYHTDSIKMYIPLDVKHIGYGAEMIFDFLEKNNIEHSSKIGREIRFDNIVVRMKSQEDAEKLANFINSQQYLQEGLIEANPFAVEKNKIAYAADKKLSYNSTLCKLIKLYIDKSYNENTKPNYQNFQLFIKDWHHDMFKDMQNININKFNADTYEHISQNYNDPEVQLMNPLADVEEEKIINYMRVAELIYKSLDPNFTYNDYIDYYNENVANYYRKPELKDNDEYNDAYSNEACEEQFIQNMVKTALIAFGTKEDKSGYKKYPNEIAVQQILSFIETGNKKYITRNKNLRDNLINTNFRKRITEYAINNNLNYNKIILTAKKNILNEALEQTANKYGEHYEIATAIKKVFDKPQDECYIHFTRDNNARYNMMAAVNKNDISNIIISEMGLIPEMNPNINLTRLPKNERDKIIDVYASNFKNRYNRPTNKK